MTGIILLAAGASNRLGQPKQTLLYHGTSLLQHAIATALQTALRPIIVVLGAHSETVKKEINTEGIRLVENPDWQLGMASSMQTGLQQALLLQPKLSSVIIMLCDQPFVDARLLKRLAEEKELSSKNIIASSYSQTLGPPVLFGKKYFPHLQSLRGHEGAKKLVKQHKYDIKEVKFEKGSIDIDTMEDYQRLLNNPDV